MHKHFKRQRLTQAIYLHIMLNIYKHHLARNGIHLPTVCVTCQNFAPQSLCTVTVHEVAWQFNNFGLQFWTDVCLAGSFLQLFLGHYSVRIGYQGEQNYTEIVIVLKHVF